MNRRRQIPLKVALGMLVFVLAAAALAAQTKIRVKNPNAVIRIEPAENGEVVLDKVAVGTIFTVERKTGPWFEIKCRSAIGLLITGYIHESAVEEVKPEPEIKPEKPPQPKPEPRAETFPNMEGGLRSGLQIGLGGGMGFTSFTGGKSTYSDVWGPYYSLQAASESGSLTTSVKNPISLGASLAYFFSPSLGIRLSIDFQTKQTIENSTANWQVTWNWYSYAPSQSQANWPLTGDFSVMPISLNAVYRFQAGRTMDLFLTAGPSYFTGTFKANSTIGYGLSWLNGGMQYRDYFAIPVALNTSINGVGFNVGAGLDILLGGSFMIFLEGDYFGGPTASAGWLVTPGTYSSTLNVGWTKTVSAALATSLSSPGYITPISVNLSFLKLMAGIKIGL